MSVIKRIFYKILTIFKQKKIDGRRSIVRMVERYLSKYFTVLENNQEFTLLEKNERQIKSLDELEVFDIDLERSKAYFNNSVTISMLENKKD